MKSLFLFILLLFAPIQGFASNALGKIVFETSASSEAQKEFLRGVLLLHSFEYEDARASFKKAQQIEPNFAMAYWGEAMTHNHPIWNERDQVKAMEALNRLAPTAEERQRKAPTQKEKDFLNAAEILFKEGEKKKRDLEYSEAMEQIHKKYPGDQEAASFYALSLLGTSENLRDYPIYMKAAAVAEEIFAKNPEHPGAVHYLIHSYDDPVHAPLGLRAARVYAKIAPDAVHALHMPSHIFLALGMWDDVESSNDASWKASKGKSYHAAYWLQYAYLQQGRFQEARALLNQVEQDAKKEEKVYGRARWHLTAMRAAYVIETQSLFSEVATSPVTPASDSLVVDIADLYAAGWSAVREKKIDEAAKYHSEIQKALKSDKASKAEAKGCESHSSDISPTELTASEIMQNELQAIIWIAQGKKDEALQLMKEMTAKEDAMDFDFGPPLPVKPSHELLGEMLLESGKYTEAQKEFESALSRAPRRTISLTGLKKAAENTGDKESADFAKKELQIILRGSR